MVYCIYRSRVSHQNPGAGEGKLSMWRIIPVQLGHFSNYIVNSGSENAAKTYFNSFKRWEAFISIHCFKSLPALPVHIAVYLTHLLDTGATSMIIYSAVYSIEWVHELNNYTDPTNIHYNSLVESAKRIACPVKEKKSSYSRNVN